MFSLINPYTAKSLSGYGLASSLTHTYIHIQYSMASPFQTKLYIDPNDRLRGHEYFPELTAAVLDALRTSQRGYPDVICSHRLFVIVPVPSPVRVRGVDDL